MSDDLLLVVEDVFVISGRGTVLCGEIASGSVAVGEEVTICTPDGAARRIRVTGLERRRALVDRAAAGDGSIGLLARGVEKADVPRGSTIRGAQPTSGPAGFDLERLHAAYEARLAERGPAAFAALRLDLDPTLPPERIVLLTTQLARETRPARVLDLLAQRANVYDALGMTTESDRDGLAWAAIKEGHSGLSRTSREWAAGIFGLEFGSTFSAAYDILTRQEGERIRVGLMRAGRAVALGYCPTCRRVETLDEKLRCSFGHANAEDVACVVPQDVTEVGEAIAAAHSV